MKTILVVDDVPFCRELFSMALQRSGYEVLTAVDGVEGLGVLKSKSIDLVILDAQMPNMDGLDMLRIMRQSPDLKALPVLMLTSLDDKQHIVRAAAIGLQGYILKTQFSLDKMLQRIERHIGPAKEEAKPLPAGVEEVWDTV